MKKPIYLDLSTGQVVVLWLFVSLFGLIAGLAGMAVGITSGYFQAGLANSFGGQGIDISLLTFSSYWNTLPFSYLAGLVITATVFLSQKGERSASVFFSGLYVGLNMCIGLAVVAYILVTAQIPT